MRLNRREKEVIHDALKALSSEYAYWGDTYKHEDIRKKLEERFRKELK